MIVAALSGRNPASIISGQAQNFPGIIATIHPSSGVVYFSCMKPSPLTLEALDSHLSYAETELEKATADRIHASDLENQWLLEVQSIKNLIKIRRNPVNGAIADISDSPSHPADTENATNSRATPPVETTHIDWIAALVSGSGDRGVSPPEILRAAEKDGIKMHPNYPYTALRTLVEKKRITKADGRYFAGKGQL